MKISKAMKQISRLKGAIQSLDKRMVLALTQLKINEYTESFNDLVKLKSETVNQLISLKDKVMAKNIEHNMFYKIITLGELKTELNFYNSLTIKNGAVSNYGDTPTVYKSQLTAKDIIAITNTLQLHINDLTDELDIFNATTDIV